MTAVAIGDSTKEVLEKLESESPVIKSFKHYAMLMKKSQDKYEKIFKIRRDITIESKRVIFLLHTIDRDSKRDAVFAEADERLKNLVSREYSIIAKELEGEDPYRHSRNISWGNQEFIEALTFLEYIRDGDVKGKESCIGLPFVPIMDYVLGIADLTGELMRRSVASIGAGNVNEVTNTRHFLRKVYTVMMGLPSNRELLNKLSVLEESLRKVERISYNLHVLGTEVPKGFLTNVESECQDPDEGYHN